MATRDKRMPRPGQIGPKFRGRCGTGEHALSEKWASYYCSARLGSRGPLRKQGPHHGHLRHGLPHGHLQQDPHQGPPEDPFLPLTNDIVFPRNMKSAKTVYPGLNKSYNRHMIVLFCPSIRNTHSTHLKFKTETYTPKRVS